MVTYDPKVIYRFAKRLYRMAAWSIWLSTCCGFLLGSIVGGGFLTSALMIVSIQAAVLVAIGCGILVGGLGYMLGSRRAFRLKLDAQLALCQVAIEEHARAQRLLAEGRVMPRLASDSNPSVSPNTRNNAVLTS